MSSATIRRRQASSGWEPDMAYPDHVDLRLRIPKALYKDLLALQSRLELAQSPINDIRAAPRGSPCNGVAMDTLISGILRLFLEAQQTD